MKRTYTVWRRRGAFLELVATSPTLHGAIECAEDNAVENHQHVVRESWHGPIIHETLNTGGASGKMPKQ